MTLDSQTSPSSGETTPAATTETTTPAQGSAPETTGGAPEGAAAAGGTPGAAAPQTPPWAPNWKVKVQDKEHEIDEFLRPVVKSPAEEKRLRELYEKAYGLDHVKPKFETARTQLQDISQKFVSQNQAVTQVLSLRDRGEYGAFFEALNIPKEKIMKWVLDEINYQQLPVDQRHSVDQQRELRQRAFSLEEQNAQLQQQYERDIAQAREMALESALARPDVKSVQDAYDARAGKPGAFRMLVGMHGLTTWQQTKKDLSPDQAVQEVMQLLGGMPQSTAPAPQGQAPTPAAPVAPGKPPVIPHVGGQSTSPVKRSPRSIADLQRLAEEQGA